MSPDPHADRQLCTFRLGDLFLGVPVEQVQEVIRQQPMTPVPRAHGSVRGLINLRGQVVAAIDLRTRFGLPPLQGGEPMNVVLCGEDEAVSLLVDDIGDVVEVSPSLHHPTPSTLRSPTRELVAGTYALPDGLLLVLDIDRALDVSGEAHAA